MNGNEIKNFLNNQNYLPKKKLEKKLFFLLKYYFFIKILFILEFIIFIFVATIGSKNNESQVFKISNDYLYTNKELFIIGFGGLIGFFVLIFYSKKYFSENKNLVFSGKKGLKKLLNSKLYTKLVIFLFIFFLLFILFFSNNLGNYLAIYFLFILFIFMLFVLVINSFLFKKNFLKLLIKKPFNGYLSITKNIENDNLIFYKKTEKFDKK